MQYYPRLDDGTCLIIVPIIFNILFRASFNKIVATLYFLSSNLLFLKNVENCRVIVDKQPRQVGRFQMPEMRSNCFGFLSSK